MILSVSMLFNTVHVPHITPYTGDDRAKNSWSKHISSYVLSTMFIQGTQGVLSSMERRRRQAHIQLQWKYQWKFDMFTSNLYVILYVHTKCFEWTHEWYVLIHLSLHYGVIYLGTYNIIHSITFHFNSSKNRTLTCHSLLHIEIDYVGVRRSPTTRSQTSPKCFVFCFFNSIKREEKWKAKNTTKKGECASSSL